MSRNYETQGFGDWLQDNASDSIAGGIGSFIGTIWNDLTGATEQQKEFEQQEYLIDKQNEYNLPSNQMARMIAAGINPNTAAGIAGAGSVSAQPSPVSTNVGGPAGAVGAVGDAVSKYSNLQLQEAQKENVIAQTKEIHDNAESNRLLQAAQRFAALKAGGVDSEKAKILSIDYKYSNLEHIQDFYLKQQNIENMRAQYKVIQDEHELKLKEIDSYDERINASVSLMEAQALEAEKHAKQMEEDTRYQKKINDFWDENDFDPKSPCDVSLKQQWAVAYKSGDYSAYEASLKAYGDSYFTAAYGNYNAESQFAGSIAYARSLGNNVAETMYGHANNIFDLAKQLGLNAKIRISCVDFSPNSVSDSDIQTSADELADDFENKRFNKIRADIVAHYNHLLELQDTYIAREGSANPIFQQQIDMCRAMLQLNNQEMIDWWKRAKPSKPSSNPAGNAPIAQ